MNPSLFFGTEKRSSFVISVAVTLLYFCLVSATLPAQTPGAYPVPWESDFSLPDQDEAGWSILIPSADSRLIYVSSTDGSDTNGRTYSPSDTDIGNDPQNPSGPVAAYASIDEAMKLMRDGYPDWILLKRGDVWINPGVIDAPAGRSPSERALISYYGSASSRPEIRTGTGPGIRYLYGQSNYSALVGVHFYAQERDPDNSDFVGFGSVGNSQGIEITETNAITQGILIEDCHFDFFEENTAQVTNAGSGSMTDIIIRRSNFTNSYGTDSYSQGLYSSKSSMLLEENLFDHNGWYQRSTGSGTADELANGQATIYNHNTYFSNVQGTIFRNNLFLRSSSIQNKFTSNPGSADVVVTRDLLLDNNFYFEGEIAISAGGNNDNDMGPRWQNILILDNLVMSIGRTQPTNRNIARGFDIEDWAQGKVGGNIFKDWGNTSSISNTFVMRLFGHISEVDVENNIVLNVSGGSGSGQETILLDGINASNIRITDNNLSLGAASSNGRRLIGLTDTDAFSFSQNNYWSEGNSDAWFTVDGAARSISGWIEDTNEIGFSALATDFVEPNRSLEGYAESLGLVGAAEAFVAAAISESRANWTGRFSALILNDYIREGLCATPNPACDDTPTASAAPMAPSWSGATVSQN